MIKYTGGVLHKFICHSLVVFIILFLRKSIVDASINRTILVNKPDMYQGLGSYFCFSFLAYLYQKRHSLPTYIDERDFIFSKSNGQFWDMYFDSAIWTDRRQSGSVSGEQEEKVQTYLEFYSAKKFGNPEKLLSEVFRNTTMSPQNLRHNVDLVRLRMSEFWKIKAGYQEEFSFRMSHELGLEGRPYLTLVIREGDKRTLEPYHLPTNMSLLRTLVLGSGLAHIHLITDSYPQYRRLQAALPRNVTVVTTCSARKGSGFFLKAVHRHWTPSQRDAEVLETLFNYEVARKAKLVYVPATTNIAVWINLLRLADGLPYSFIQATQRQFNYFQNYLPFQQP